MYYVYSLSFRYMLISLKFKKHLQNCLLICILHSACELPCSSLVLYDFQNITQDYVDQSKSLFTQPCNTTAKNCHDKKSCKFHRLRKPRKVPNSYRVTYTPYLDKIKRVVKHLPRIFTVSFGNWLFFSTALQKLKRTCSSKIRIQLRLLRLNNSIVSYVLLNRKIGNICFA